MTGDPSRKINTTEVTNNTVDLHE